MIAITRAVSASFNRCELTHISREPIDVGLARAQHAMYERALETAGCTVVRLEEAAELPDSVFVEDTAIVVDELAILTRPGAPSRRAETPAVAPVLGRYRRVHTIDAPATIDGGDVLLAGRTVFVGRSARTNDAAVQQMRALLEPHQYAVHAIQVTGCLHLKSAVSAIADDRLLINPSWIAREAFHAFDLVDVDPREPGAANVLRVGDNLIYPASYPRTLDRLTGLGLRVQTVDLSEIAKAEGAVTCCSLILLGDADPTKR